MIKTYYHGTDYESALCILTAGFNAPSSIWLNSELTKTYFVSPDANPEAINFAIDAAFIAAAYKNTISPHLAILVLEIDDSETFPDDSDESMEKDCIQIDSKYLNELINSGKASLTAKVLENAYNPYLRPCYLAYIYDRHNDAMSFEDEKFESAVKYMSRYLNSGGYDLCIDHHRDTLDDLKTLKATKSTGNVLCSIRIDET